VAHHNLFKDVKLRMSVVSIQCGLFQGDTLSPVLFCLSLNPLSLLLDTLNGYQATATQQLNHMLYMDDLKLFAKSDVQLKTLLQAVNLFSDDVGLSFGIEKWAKLSVSRSKVNLSGGIALSPTVDVREINSGEVYKYLAFFEAEGLDCQNSKNQIMEIYTK